MDILGVYEPHLQALFDAPTYVCSRANAHPQNATGKDLPKSSSIKKNHDLSRKPSKRAL